MVKKKMPGALTLPLRQVETRLKPAETGVRQLRPHSWQPDAPSRVGVTGCPMGLGPFQRPVKPDAAPVSRPLNAPPPHTQREKPPTSCRQSGMGWSLPRLVFESGKGQEEGQPPPQTPPPSPSENVSGEKSNFVKGKDCWAIFGTQTSQSLHPTLQGTGLRATNSEQKALEWHCHRRHSL